MESDTQEQQLNRQKTLRRAVPIAAALALGAGAGAGVYAGPRLGRPFRPDHGRRVRPAQPAATTTASTPLTTIYKNTAPGVVDIRRLDDVPATTASAGGPSDQSSQAEGSGFVYDSNGDIVTNAHVVDGPTRSRSASRRQGGQGDARRQGRIDRHRGHQRRRRRLGAAPADARHVRERRAGPDGRCDRQPVRPRRLDDGRDHQRGQPHDHRAEQLLDLRLDPDRRRDQPRQLGRPAARLVGEVIGVNAQIESNSNDNAGVGFAIPIDAAKWVADTIISGGTVQHAYVGVPSATRRRHGRPGQRVVGGSPADKAGLQAGDVITAIDGESISTADDLTALVNTYKPGDVAKLTVDAQRLDEDAEHHLRSAPDS